MKIEPIGSAWSRWRGELTGGIVPALGLFATDVGYGLMAYAPLGLAFADEGIVAAFLAAVVGSIVSALVGGAGPLAGGARPAQTLIFASLLVSLMHANHGVVDPQRFMIVAAMCVALSGVFQMLFGRFGLGRAIKYAPLPVLSGFTNGVALSMAVSAFGLLFIQEADTGSQAMEPFSVAGRIGVVLVLLLLMYGFSKHLAKLHWSLVGLLAGMLLYQGFSAVGWGPLLGASLPHFAPREFEFPLLLATSYNGGWLDLSRDLSLVVAPALTIATLNSLEALIIASHQDLATGTRHNSNRVLVGQGLGNIVGGLLGALPSAPSNSRQHVSRQAGGKSRATSVIFGLTMLVVLAITPQLMPAVPKLAVAAILLYMAYSIVDGWTVSQLRIWMRRAGDAPFRQQIRGNLLVMVVVMLVAVITNLVAAMAVGVIISMFLFVSRHSRSIIARVYFGNRRQSLVMRPEAHKVLLKTHGQRIALVQLEGPLFFGSADPLFDAIEALPVSADHIILDFRGVGEIETSGAAAVQRIARFLTQHQAHLYLASIDPGNERGRTLIESSQVNYLPNEIWHVDADYALEAAEDRLLQALGASDIVNPDVQWTEMDAFRGFTSEQIRLLRHFSERKALARNEPLFRRGDPGDVLFVVAAGRIEIRLGTSDGSAGKRLVALCPGMVFGEMAVLRGLPRSADAVSVADNTDVLSLNSDQLKALRLQHPEISDLFLTNIGNQMANRLASATDELSYALGVEG